ncbi:MAG: VCBS repeat-containing protein, partial [Cyclobacteriaceae bacterium]|nr:VCBS repeat-containing protein [Cyclobacteriaceae bacterium]
VSSGGNEFPLNALDLADRLYLNDGKGNFTKSENSGLQSLRGSSSVVVPIDINEDGAMDLFIGDRLVPFVYGAPASSHIWINDGKGQFTEQTQNYAPELLEIGMVTDAAKLDWDGDGKEDLVLVGDWMAPTFFRNTGGKLEKISMPEMESKKGWYRSLKVADLNKDQKPDLILGNQGLNTRFKASEEQPVRLYLNDFDQNGSIEQLFTTVRNGVAIPYTLKHELEKQVPSIKKKYIRYSNYNNQTLEQIFDQETIGKSIISEVNHLESGVLMNQGSGKFEWKSLPIEAQRSMIFAIETADLDGDGILDLILGGNLYGIKPEIGKSDASYGEVLLGNGDGTFRFIPNRIHSMQLQGEVRHFKWLYDSRLLVIKNNAAAEIWKYEE